MYQSFEEKVEFLSHNNLEKTSSWTNSWQGGFCGYRNIQMLVSYIIDTQGHGAQHFNGQLPSVFQIQEYIENAWDSGINSHGRVETGGVKGTRKYIGTPEVCIAILLVNSTCFQSTITSLTNQAQAMLCALEISYATVPAATRRGCSSMIGANTAVRSCNAQGFKDRQSGKSETLVYRAIEAYFEGGINDKTSTIHQTVLPPLYFQHAGE
jgi:zinc finger-containing ubiquitin peptidase 1